MGSSLIRTEIPVSIALINDTIFSHFATKMEAEGLTAAQILRFENDYQRFLQARTGAVSPWILESDIASVGAIPHLSDDLVAVDEAADLEALSKVVVLKLNGGLGTTMGLQVPKGIIPVKNGLSFLELAVKQLEVLQKRNSCKIPILLMNSYSTESPTEEVLAKLHLQQTIPTSFLQSKVPKIDANTNLPVEWPTNPNLEWCPPGHGEIYSALVGSGLIEHLLQRGYRYLFVSNVDNLGATLSLPILRYFAQRELDFLMEVTDRTEEDRKGGHLARSAQTGRLLLRESGQCSPTEKEAFQDIRRYAYFNTNNLWLKISAIPSVASKPLPLIENRKTVDPADPSSPAVYQLESAMGAAISVFDSSEAIRVDRTRFAPVKSSSDFLKVSSNLYQLNEDFRLDFQGKNPAAPTMDLDSRYYSRLPELLARFPLSADLLHCESLKIRGDHSFETEMPVFRGFVELGEA
jgi:UDP-N-acetylglucosamine pyrophosphorylase